LAPWLVVVLCTAACGGSTNGGPPLTATTTPTTAPVITTASLGPTSTADPTTTAVAHETTSSTAPETTMRLTIVYDNTADDSRLAAAWGFAALVDTTGGRLLFDTGGDGALLLANMALLDIDPSTIDAVVLSHQHEDHIGGMAALLGTGATPTVYLPASFAPTSKQWVAERTQLVEITGPQQILPGVFTTGEMGDGIIEQALVVETAAGSVVITGCSHPGIVEVVRRAREVCPGRVALVVGGFHLSQATTQRIQSIVAAFRELEVQQVAPAHCTGAAATEAFAREYGDDFLTAGAGRVIEVG
jgi:7,8-dihydropterin-6-yl-methyl-4-(beta-D-ribofuranosyl)aminobenzene 5'-phosphate synthase